MKKQMPFLFALLVVAGACISLEFAASCAVLSGLFVMMHKYVQKCHKTQKWALMVLAVLVVAPGSLWLTMVAASITAAIFLLKHCSTQMVYGAGMAVVALFSGIGLFPLDAWAAAHGGLSDAVDQVKNVLVSVKDAVPVIGYAAGAGFGGTGLIEIVKSKNGQGGDFGAGMKKLLVGGGLAGLGGMLDMTSQDITGETAGSHTGPTFK